MQQAKQKNLEILAKRIKDLRTKNLTSLNKFCFTNGDVTTATWSRIENALTDPKFTTLLEISYMLKISLSELFKDLEFISEENYSTNQNKPKDQQPI